MAADLGITRDTLMAHYLSNHVAVAYGDIFDEMVALVAGAGIQGPHPFRERVRAMSEKLYLGIDVGTGSVRAGIFDGRGKGHGAASVDIKMWRPQADFVEQSSEDIWTAAGQAVRAAMKEAGCTADDVRGIGFDATCSLVVWTRRPAGDGEPERIGRAERHRLDGPPGHGPDRAHQRHRAGVLEYVGGQVSPEMQTPKLLWLKENMPETWRRAARFLDLPDYLSYRATGDDTRSLCTTVCKWTYLGHEEPKVEGSVGRWEDSYFQVVGLDDLADEGYSRIGRRVRPMGEPVGKGLTEKAAQELGLRPGTAVGVAIIDAHAGGLGLLGAPLDGDAPETPDFDRRLALICGTSTCHMAVSPESRFIPGVWGPYFSAMVPGMWLNEGGQSATGCAHRPRDLLPRPRRRAGTRGGPPRHDGLRASQRATRKARCEPTVSRRADGGHFTCSPISTATAHPGRTHRCGARSTA